MYLVPLPSKLRANPSDVKLCQKVPEKMSRIAYELSLTNKTINVKC